MNNSNVSLQRKHKAWIIIEKIVGFILLAWSIYVLYMILSGIAGVVRSGYISTGKITYASMAANDHLIILVGILGLFGSCMLLYKDRIGWLLSSATSIMYGLILFISSRSRAVDNTLPLAKYYKSYGAAALIFFVIFLLLIAKPIRARYQPTFKTWLWLLGLVVLFIIDKLIFPGS